MKGDKPDFLQLMSEEIKKDLTNEDKEDLNN